MAAVASDDDAPLIEARCTFGSKAQLQVVGETPCYWKVVIKHADVETMVPMERAVEVYNMVFRVRKRPDGQYGIRAPFGYVPDAFTFEYKP